MKLEIMDHINKTFYLSMKTNLLIGAISGNYTIEDVRGWIETSNFDNVERVLLLYNNNSELEEFLINNNIQCIKPTQDFWGRSEEFTTNTGTMNLASSYTLIHNIRFYHIWQFLMQSEYKNVIITDIRDVYFNANPFEVLDINSITATSEIITYEQEEWNKQHLYENLGFIGIDLLLNKPVYNVGVFGGPVELIKDLCSDIYLLSVGKPKVADQTSFNYLIHTKYKNVTKFTDLTEQFAVHLHVINAGLVEFDLNKVSQYKIVHQYDRIKNFKR